MVSTSKKLSIVNKIFIFFINFIVVGILFLWNWSSFNYEEHLDGPYYVVAVDILEQMSLSFQLSTGDYSGRIDETVFAVGWNENYIVAKQHPEGVKTETVFYYLIRNSDHELADPPEVVRGPFTKREFLKEKEKLKLPDFSKEFSNLR